MAVTILFTFCTPMNNFRESYMKHINPSQAVAEYRRHRAVELMERGETKEVISRILGVCRGSLNSWWRMSRRGEDLKTKPIKGRPRRMTDQQLEKLGQLLSEGATAHGWENNLWTSARVREVIQKHFGITFTRWHVWRIVRYYLGWTARRPVHQTKKRDEKAIELWKSSQLPRIVRETSARDAYLVLVDETGFMMTPTIRRTFAPPGQTPVNKVSDPHGRVSVIGAISISPIQKRLGWHYHMLRDNVNFRGDTIVEFLEILKRQIACPMTIVWDSIIIHWSNVVDEYLAKHSDIVSEFLPPYAPELNPVDRAWFYIKYDRLPNFTPLTTTHLRKSITRELQRLKSSGALLRSFIHHSSLPFLI